MRQYTTFRFIAFASLSLIFCAVSLAADDAKAPEDQASVRTEEYTLPGGSKVTVENQTRVLYQETGANSLDKKLRRVAIFVRNNAGKEFEDAVTRIQDQVAALASGENFEFIDYRDAVLAMEALPDALPTAEGVEQVRATEKLQSEINQKQGHKSEKNLGGSGTTTDERLLSQTSITHLAQQLEADYILRLSLDRFDKSVRDRNFGEARWQETTYTLSATYKLMDFGGYAIGGNTLKVKRVEKKGDADRSQMGAYADGLDEEAGEKLAQDMLKNAGRWREASLARSKIPVSFDAIAMTMDEQPLYLPEFDPAAGQVNLESQVPVRIMALVEVDGVTVGTTDCEVPLTPGLHKVRFYREGHDPVSMTINAREGLRIITPMRITQGEMQRVQKLQKFIHDLTLERKTGEAVVKQIEGEAEMLRNSHIRIDAANLPDINIYKSLY